MPDKAPGIDYDQLIDGIMQRLTGKTPAPSPAQAAAQPAFQVSPEMQGHFDRNKQWLAKGNQTYNTQLSPDEEKQFRSWLTEKIPEGTNDYRGEFKADDQITDYDMRGFWKAKMAGDPRATEAVSPVDQTVHRSDYWKTPYDATFSRESQWADPRKAPAWYGNKLVLPNGTVIFDEQAQHAAGKPLG
jgi:hypothetical protein